MNLSLRAVTVAVALGVFPIASLANNSLMGSWKAETYIMKGGQISYQVRGQIIFAKKDWTVLFFTIKDGKVVRGSGEGGYYKTEGSQLIFFHKYFAGPAFGAIPGLKSQKGGAFLDDPPKREPTTYAINGDHLTIHFGPSGNTLTWTRSSG